MSMDVLTNPGLLWFLVGVILLISELFTPTVVLMFFGLGAWTVAVVYLIFDISFAVQLAFFANTSILFGILLRRKLRPIFLGFISSRQNPNRNLDDFLGKEAVVIEAIAPGQPGKVEFNGVLWNAQSEQTIDVQKRVRITGRNGLSLDVNSI